MRAERLLAVLMLLKKHDRMTAAAMADKLGVSERTILRDIDALSLSGVPVYAERGRNGGFALLPGYRTDLTGLTLDEATSLLAGTGRLDSPAFAAAMRKVAAAMPEAYRSRAVRAAARVLVRPEGFVRSPEKLDALAPVQQAVFDGRRIRLVYRRPGAEPGGRTLDPVGLVVAGDVWYLVANSQGVERIYRVSRMSDVEVLDEPAQRDDEVDLEQAWARHRAAFRASFESIDVVIDCAAKDVDRFLALAADGGADGDIDDGGVRVRLRFADRQHATRVLWMACLESDYVMVEPDWLREIMRTRAMSIAEAPLSPGR
ncbi:helix-turn-helix transcriptional regulator [Gordonia rhizosphera]|uniref:Putative DeoR family transcriptional regulator n=1 Tax=Gordonia rhizosphera NBRC 16068 TaxID=1108045 RepID=K6UZE4_9ACTN|nr:WYL domain-containing protein [Gordonia rhizosphera]GAB88858.1 putative DeoR family transcriptional regulator [Gordonia rhizosphera NBRC 16068]